MTRYFEDRFNKYFCAEIFRNEQCKRDLLHITYNIKRTI